MTFNQIWSEIGSRSQLGETRSRYLYNLLKTCRNVSGRCAEVGAYMGITSRLMQLAEPNRELHVFDTFNGIVNVNPTIDRHQNGDFCCSLDSVKQVLGERGVVYHVGSFPNTYPTCSFNTWAFVHSDTDTYAGSLATLEKFWPHMSKGALMLFDDYANECCLGVEKALTEWSASTGVEVLLSPDRWQAHVIKA